MIKSDNNKIDFVIDKYIHLHFKYPKKNSHDEI